MTPQEIIATHYPDGSIAARILTAHGNAVARKAIAIAEAIRPQPDMDLVWEGALLHDVGMFVTDVPEFGCHGRQPYIRHGILGRRLLEKLGRPRHGLICERHVGAGLSLTEILAGRHPLPHRDMLPVSVEEEIICYADKFFSKSAHCLELVKPLAAVRAEMRRYSPTQAKRFDTMHARFGQ